MSKLSRDTSELLFSGLRQLSEAAFPKRCPACGAIYHTAEDFIQQTESLAGGRSIKAIDDEEEGRFLELYRNCHCGSTLMDFFSDRRNATPKGLARRKKFGELMTLLEQRGVSTAEARQELLRFLHGQPTPLLEKLGLHSR